MSRILLSSDPVNGIDQYHDYDEETDTSTFICVGDVEPVLENNKKLANDNDTTSRGIKNGWWRYASIPIIFQYKLLAEKGINVYKREDARRLSQVLEDPEYRHLKCTTKKHILKA